MRRPQCRPVIGVLLVSLLAVPVAARATHDGPDERRPQEFANGGGQIVLDLNDPAAGAGDTIAFTARKIFAGDKEMVQGEAQYVGSDVAGQPRPKWHADVDCLEVEQHTAIVGGEIHPEGASVSGRFALRVEDRGTRDDTEQADSVELVYGPETQGTCDAAEFEDIVERALGRGNVTVHDPE